MPKLRKSSTPSATTQAKTPRPKLVEVYTTIAGGQDVFLLRRGEVDNKQGKAEPGFIQVLYRGDVAAPRSFCRRQRQLEPAAEDPRVRLASG